MIRIAIRIGFDQILMIVKLNREFVLNVNAWVKEMSGMNELKSFGGDNRLIENAEWWNVPETDGKYRMHAEEILVCEIPR